MAFAAAVKKKKLKQVLKQKHLQEVIKKNKMKNEFNIYQISMILYRLLSSYLSSF
jgi:hypothetical protein